VTWMASAFSGAATTQGCNKGRMPMRLGR
jgi:hypothetical protein